ncbi:hypothetical protein THIOM_001323 [Candidatus Thiomargarita nelsonii]|uniref:Uncharacterized protein n=1 Tax=Candidatus Thiomargarita nelsonii TaxID=1003181 RepID=A0A176S4J4_9GAMM|nr:hypothetical protein THIOM_001323 [Candidatus Thiomargarita nelsonii]
MRIREESHQKAVLDVYSHPDIAFPDCIRYDLSFRVPTRGGNLRNLDGPRFLLSSK